MQPATHPTTPPPSADAARVLALLDRLSPCRRPLPAGWAAEMLAMLKPAQAEAEAAEVQAALMAAAAIDLARASGAGRSVHRPRDTQ